MTRAAWIALAAAGVVGGKIGDSDTIYDPLPSEPIGQCQADCNYPPSYDNGDPCIAPDGSRTCASSEDIPSVPVVGQRPAEEPMSMPVCRPTSPFSAECGVIPPVIGGGFEQLPRGPAPWFPQSWCDAANFFCSQGQGQVPDNDRGEDADTSGKTQAQLNAICETVNTAEMVICSQNQKWGVINYRAYLVCEQNANSRLYACYATAKRLTGNGSYPAP